MKRRRYKRDPKWPRPPVVLRPRLLEPMRNMTREEWAVLWRAARMGLRKLHPRGRRLALSTGFWLLVVPCLPKAVTGGEPRRTVWLRDDTARVAFMKSWPKLYQL